MDLDADAKLNLKEFIDAVRPVENFTQKRAIKSAAAGSQKQRPRSSNLMARQQQQSQISSYGIPEADRSPKQFEPNMGGMYKSQ